MCVRTKEFFAGYYDNPGKSVECIKDGWFHTGDFGYFDDEGFLFVVDRKINLIRYFGVNFTPIDIEEVINKMEGIVASSVVPVTELGIDYIYAFVIKKPDSSVIAEDIVEYVNSRVSDYKHLRGGAYFVDSFPLTPSGKIKKQELRTLAEEIHQKKAEKHNFAPI